MKKLFTIAILGLLSTGAFAQTTQGTKVVSGSISFNNSRDKAENSNTNNHKSVSTGFSFSPSIGYFLKDNLKVSAFVGYSYSNTLNTNDNPYATYSESEHQYSRYSIGTSLTKYFMLTDKLALTGSGAVTIFKETGETKYTSDAVEKYEGNADGYSIAIGPGIAFFPTERIGITTSFGRLSYYRTKNESTNEYATTKSTYSDLGLDLDSSTFGIGFSYHFNR